MTPPKLGVRRNPGAHALTAESEERAADRADLPVSVIIPSYNSMATIERCLRSVSDQSFGGAYEILLLDSSDDGTDAFVAREFPEVKLHHFPARTLPGIARNEGIRRARGEILAFTDSDCVVDPRWLERILARHAAEDCAAVGGSVTNGLRGNPVAWSGLLVEFNEFLPGSPERDVQLLPTCNVAFKREVFERHGLFPEDLWPSEDHVFSHRLVEAGERLRFDPAIAIEHLFRPRFRDFLRHQRRLGSASATARQTVALPNAWLASSPLRWLTPLFRLARIETRLLLSDPASFLLFNLLLPWCMAGLISWGMGFSRRDAS